MLFAVKVEHCMVLEHAYVHLVPLLVINLDVAEAQRLPPPGDVLSEEVQPVLPGDHAEPELRRPLDVGEAYEEPGIGASAPLSERCDERELPGKAQRKHRPCGQ